MKSLKETINSDFAETVYEAEEVYYEQEDNFVHTVQNLYGYGTGAGLALVVIIFTLPLLAIMRLLLGVIRLISFILKPLESTKSKLQKSLHSK